MNGIYLCICTVASYQRALSPSLCLIYLSNLYNANYIANRMLGAERKLQQNMLWFCYSQHLIGCIYC